MEFILLFILYLILEYLFLYFFPQGFETWQREQVAFLLGRFLSFIGIAANVVGDTVNFSQGSMRIVYECTGGFAFFVFSSAVLAYPSNAKSKLLGQIFGLVSIFILNILRLIIISIIMVKSPSLFDLFHKYLWQASFIVIVVFLFILWVEKWAKE